MFYVTISAGLGLVRFVRAAVGGVGTEDGGVLLQTCLKMEGQKCPREACQDKSRGNKQALARTNTQERRIRRPDKTLTL